MREFIRQMHINAPSDMGDGIHDRLSVSIEAMVSDVIRRAQYTTQCISLTKDQVIKTVNEIREKRPQCLAMSIDALSMAMYNTLHLKMTKSLTMYVTTSSFCYELFNMLMYNSSNDGETRVRIIQSIMTQAARDLGWESVTAHIDIHDCAIVINNHFVINQGEYMTLDWYEIMCKNVIDVGDELTSDNYIKMFKELIDDVAPYAELLNRMGELYIDNPNGIDVDTGETAGHWIDRSRYDLDIPTTQVVEI